MNGKFTAITSPVELSIVAPSGKTWLLIVQAKRDFTTEEQIRFSVLVGALNASQTALTELKEFERQSKGIL